MFTALRVIGRVTPPALSSSSSSFNDNAPRHADKPHGGRAGRFVDDVLAVDGTRPGRPVLFFGRTARFDFSRPRARPRHRHAAVTPVRVLDRYRDDRRRRRTYRPTGHGQERHRVRDREREQAGRGQADIQELLQRLSRPVQREYATFVRWRFSPSCSCCCLHSDRPAVAAEGHRPGVVGRPAIRVRVYRSRAENETDGRPVDPAATVRRVPVLITLAN